MICFRVAPASPAGHNWAKSARKHMGRTLLWHGKTARPGACKLDRPIGRTSSNALPSSKPCVPRGVFVGAAGHTKIVRWRNRHLIGGKAVVLTAIVDAIGWRRDWSVLWVCRETGKTIMDGA